MSIIVPAILEQTKEGFLDKVARVVKLPGVERIQVDFADNVFVPNQTLEIGEINPLNPAFHWEAHLMQQSPADFLDYKIAGFKTVIVHYEAYAFASELEAAITEIKSLGLEPGICLKIETPISVLKEFESGVSLVQLMSIHPGFQGTPFLEETYNRITELRKLIPGAIIEIDGGINLSNAKKVVLAGADLIIAGSVLAKAPDMSAAFEQLESSLSSS